MCPDDKTTFMDDKKERIAKVMARAGLCSRRDAERWIAEGRVSVNGTYLKTPAVTVGAEDKIVVDGKPLPIAPETRLFLYHKPTGLVTTAKDEKGRPTVFDNLPKGLPRVVSIGRLDINSEGLLLLTNNGELARHLELPATGWRRCYRVRVHGRPNQAMFHKLKNGITIDGMKYGPIEVRLEQEKSQGANNWLFVSLHEGKNREVRKVMEHLELPVNRLIRVAYGPFTLGDLPEGAAMEPNKNILHEHLPEYFK